MLLATPFLIPAAVIAAAMQSAPIASPPPPQPSAHRAAPSGVGATVPLRYDRKGRPVIGAEVNGRGPFDMVVDTAAQVSLVTPSLAQELALPRLSSSMAIKGATGVAAAALHGVDRLSSGLFEVRDAAVPTLDGDLTDARGIVGMHVAADRKLTFDRQAGTLGVAPSGNPAPGFVAVRGRINAAGLLVVPIRVNGRTVDALVDTGSEGVIAGPRLLDLLGWRADDPRLKAYGAMRGAGGAGGAVRRATMDTIAIGPVTFSAVPVIIAPGGDRADGARPQVILGADMLGMLSAYAVDLRMATLEIRVPK